MAYAEPQDLAEALRIAVTETNEALLQACLEAAAEEIDNYLDRPAEEPFGDPPPAVVVRVNVARAVEHYKAGDAAFGVLGFDFQDPASPQAVRTPRDSFDRYATILSSYKRRWGIA